MKNQSEMFLTDFNRPADARKAYTGTDVSLRYETAKAWIIEAVGNTSICEQPAGRFRHCRIFPCGSCILRPATHRRAAGSYRFDD
jgi:hypothetical protein